MKPPVTATYQFSQEGDSCGGPDYQHLSVSVDDAGAGSFVILQTDRWSLDLDELEAFIERLRWCAANVKSIFEEGQEEEEKAKQPKKQTAWKDLEAQLEPGEYP